jgi:recombinational DNA repair protein RecR
MERQTLRVTLHEVLRRIFRTGSEEEEATETRITRNSITIFTHCYQCDQLKKDEISGTCKTRGRHEKFIYVPFHPGNLKGRDMLRDVGVGANSGIFEI